MKKEKVDISTLSPEEREKRRKHNKRFNRILYTVSALLILTGIYIILNDQTLIVKNFGNTVAEKFNEYVKNETPVPKPTLPPFPTVTFDPNQMPLPWGSSNEDDWTQWLGGYWDPRYTQPPYVSATAGPQDPYQTQAPVWGEPEPTPYNPYEPKNVYFVGHDISCPVQPVGYNQYGQMAVVPSAYIVGWFRYGGDPVRGGNTLIAGHIRHKGSYGYFSIIRDGLKAGDYVIVEMQNGQHAYYVVSRVESYVYNQVPNDIMYTGGDRRLTLITCMDDYSAYHGTSLHRVIAVCYPVYFGNPNPTAAPTPQEPNETPMPAITPDAQQTDAPQQTPGANETPQATEAPENTEAPERTRAPEDPGG